MLAGGVGVGGKERREARGVAGKGLGVGGGGPGVGRFWGVGVGWRTRFMF